MFAALEPEVSSVPYKKTSTYMRLESQSVLSIEVTGDDISALRGSFHTYLNWIKTIIDSFDAAGHNQA